jgi:hypothetical protein
MIKLIMINGEEKHFKMEKGKTEVHSTDSTL